MTPSPDQSERSLASHALSELFDGAALQQLLEQNPDLCRQLELAMAAHDESPGASSADEVTIDLGSADRPAAATDVLLGQFGEYELLEEIGRGGMGVVFRARQQSLGRIVALKMILSGEFANAQDLKRFHAEASAAAKLSHAHIVPIYEVGQREGRSYFSMAFVDGPTLDHVLKMRALDPATAAEIVRKIAIAAAYAHEQGIIHRDLKPANILLDSKGEPRIADFGLAKWREGEGTDERTGDIVGTPSYMAPEQAAGRVNEITDAADVYSLGAILYACLTGRPPFAAESKLDTILAVLESEATLPRQINPQIPRELQWIVLRCLEKRPENRYPSATALADDLQRYLLGEPVEARRAGTWPRLRRWSRRQPTLVAHLAVIGLMVSALQALYWTLGGSHQYMLSMTLLFAAWAVVSVFFQQLLHSPHRAEMGRFAWAATDAGLLTTALYLTGPPLDGLLVGYPLLVVASGLFFRVRLVVFMLAACLTGFGMLVYLISDARWPLYSPIYFAIGLAALGMMVAYQVHRIRVLSRYYHKDPAE